MGDEKAIDKRVGQEGFAASVELPEGHQLVIGELPPGTIVEVATWQGTGRPDESTNRFLLSASGSGLQRRGSSKERNSQAEIEAPVEVSEIAQASNLSMGSIGAAGSRVESRHYAVENTAANVAIPKKWKRVRQSLFSFIAVIAISSFLLSIAGISAVVPDRGAKTALGPSTSALVIYKKSPSVAIGNPTVAIGIVNGVDGYIFGPSNSFDETTIQIETTAGQELVEVKNVSGRAFLAIPLIGILVKPFTK